ncbi:MAG TPA: Fe-S-containing hydro-lyase [Dissulfurispiraceae bacterium]|nr:Fe-S-containing hydro-lyase [Dissulfurispiraceae bacterium]
MAAEHRLTTPLSDEDVLKLKAGDVVFVTGTIYTGRDAAHKRMFEALDKGESLPFDIKGALIYYVGPAPAPPGRPIGSCGPTTSYRMDTYAPRLHSLGLKGTIGKGKRNDDVKEAMKKYKAVYLAATGGAGALLSLRVQEAKVVAYEDLGPEAVMELKVKDFPLLVINDAFGGELYVKPKI